MDNENEENQYIEESLNRETFADKPYRKSTIKIYTKRAESLLSAYEKETGMSWVDNPMAIAPWFHDRSTQWRHSTFRMSRLSLLYYLEQKVSAPIELLRLIEKTEYKSITPAERFTILEHNEENVTPDAKRIRRFPESDMQVYLDALNPKDPSSRSGAFDYLLSLFLKWNVDVGLRPSEVGDMEIIEADNLEDVHNQEILVVRNRKVNEVRGNGDYRVLNLIPDIMKMAKELIKERDRFYAIGLSWEEIQNGMMRRMNQIRHEVGGPTYTLYSTRHQYAANSKASGFSRQDIADRMGHASLETAQSTYGKKKAGRPTGTGVTKAQGITEDHLRALREMPRKKIRMRIKKIQPE